jgi:hypothetical protein
MVGSLKRRPMDFLGAALALAAILWAGPAQVQADQMQLQVDGMNAGLPVTVYLDGSAINTQAGQFQAHLDGGGSSFQSGTAFNAFCVDLSHFSSPGQDYSVNSLSAGALANGSQVAYLYDKYGSSTLTDNTLAAALQLAIWDEVMDGGKGLDQGPFQFLPTDASSQALADLASSLIGEANANQAPGSGLFLDASPSGDDLNRGQSLFGQPPTPTVIPSATAATDNPEPATIALFGVALAGLFVYRRCKTRPA